MPDIRNLIGQPVQEFTEEIEHQGERYLFKGTPNASNLAEGVLLDDEKKARLAKHWSVVTGVTVVPEIVSHTVVIHQTLQSAQWNPDTNQWAYFEPYDISDVAKLVVRDAQFFVKALAAGYKCLGLSEEQQKHYTTFEQVVSGNSGKPEATD